MVGAGLLWCVVVVVVVESSDNHSELNGSIRLCVVESGGATALEGIVVEKC